MTTVGELAAHVRSKNAGPFWMTLDIFFDDEESYERVATSPLLSPAAIAARYGSDPEQVRMFRMASIKAIKISLPRPTPQGSFAERDMHSGQQFVLLEQIEV